MPTERRIRPGALLRTTAATPTRQAERSGNAPRTVRSARSGPLGGHSNSCRRFGGWATWSGAFEIPVPKRLIDRATRAEVTPAYSRGSALHGLRLHRHRLGSQRTGLRCVSGAPARKRLSGRRMCADHVSKQFIGVLDRRVEMLAPRHRWPSGPPGRTLRAPRLPWGLSRQRPSSRSWRSRSCASDR